MLRFIKSHNIRPIRKGLHDNGRNFWVFEMTDELSKVLTAWTNYKRKRDEAEWEKYLMCKENEN
jgi:hypothetical protein